MGLAVSSYFVNGGGKAYIARLTQNAATASLPAGKMIPKITAANPLAADNLLAVEAREVGVDGNSTEVTVSDLDTAGATFTLAIESGDTTETYKNVNMNERSARFVVTVVNQASKLVKLSYLPTFDAITPVADKDKVFKQGSIKGSGAAVLADLSGGGMLKFVVDGSDIVAVDIPKKGSGNYTNADILGFIKGAVPAGESGYVASQATGTFTIKSKAKKSYSSITVLKNATSDSMKLTTGTPTIVRGTDLITPANLGATSLAGGSDGIEPTTDDYKKFFGDELVKLRDVSIILLPGKVLRDADRPVIDAAIAHCKKTKSRMVIVDPPSGTELKTLGDIGGLALPTASYAVLYYPWLKVSNPFFHPKDNPTASRTLPIPPSAAAAGTWANVDARRGVWKAPAGINTGLLGIVGTEFDVEDGIQDQLNPEGVNCIRNIPRFNFVFWGARTLATNADPEWRYVPIRRTAIMIERSIYDGIQWAVFEPNDHKLWASLRLNIGNFMDGLFRAGAFQGEKASDAYFVNCGLNDTMTQSDIDNGQVIVEVGFAPLKPAEFVIVRIQQIVGQAR